LLDHFEVKTDITDCKIFLSAASMVAQRLQQMSLGIRNKQAPEFNIFTITRRGHYEVTTHSRFIGALLNPTGTHEQGNLFLAAFLDLLLSKKPNLKLPKADHRWTISLEDDSIDIVLSHPSPHNPQTRIILENKWGAPDREDQLFGYWRRQRQLTGLKSLPAIYLPPEGRRPEGLGAMSDSQFLKDLVTLSYTEDILMLLDKHMPEIGSNRVSETISQYIQLIERIDET